MEEFLVNILNKFNRPITPIIKYKPVYEYKDQKYSLNSIDYIYLFLNSLTNISAAYGNYCLHIDSIYKDIFKKDNDYKNYSQDITINILKNNNFEITKHQDVFFLFNENTNEISKNFIDIIKEIIDILTENKKIKIYIISCAVKYNSGYHSELIIFQIHQNNLYIVNYDPQGYSTVINIMNVFMDYIKDVAVHILDENKSSLDVKVVYKENLTFQYQNKNISGLQDLTDDFSFLGKRNKTNQGLCLLYSLFMVYFLINVIYNYSDDYSCDKIITNIEYIMYDIFIENNQIFAQVFINFGNYILNRYYEYFISQIDNYFEKQQMQKEIEENFKELFKDLIQTTNNGIEKYDKIDLSDDSKKSSGYKCKEDIECSSYKCVNNYCYIDEKDVNPEDIRSVGNPCLYNIQCRSGNCKDYVCIGEDKHEKGDNYDTRYDPDEIIEYEILDMENNDKYLNM